MFVDAAVDADADADAVADAPRSRKKEPPFAVNDGPENTASSIPAVPLPL